MTNTSATGGYLLPNPASVGTDNLPAPLYDDALIDFYQPTIVGITGLDGSLVRPRWQEVPPTLPPPTTTWIAIGITMIDGDTFAFIGHQSKTYTGAPINGQRDVLQRQEELQMLCSCYGSNSEGTAALIRDGLAIAQNREPWQLARQGLINVGGLTKCPEKINNLWYRRTDVIVYIRRAVIRTYPVLDLLSASGSVESDQSPLTRDFIVSNS